MKKNLLLLLIFVGIVFAAIIVTEKVVFSKDCYCLAGSHWEIRQVCTYNCRQREDGGCGAFWIVSQKCADVFSDLCKTKWYWECMSSLKYGYYYTYTPCPQDCP